MVTSEEWEPTVLTLKRSSYQIKVSRTEEVVVEEKYSPSFYVSFSLPAMFICPVNLQILVKISRFL